MYSTPDREILHGYSVVRVSLDDDGAHTVRGSTAAISTSSCAADGRWRPSDWVIGLIRRRDRRRLVTIQPPLNHTSPSDSSPQPA